MASLRGRGMAAQSGAGVTSIGTSNLFDVQIKRSAYRALTGINFLTLV